jgi:hypothetical protein
MIWSNVRRRRGTAYVGIAAASLLVAGVAVSAAPGVAAAAGTDNCSSSNVKPGLTRVGHFGGISRPKSTGHCATAAEGRDPNGGGGTPPLLYHGGDMMATRAVKDRVAITPIYWAPSGYSFTTSYKSLINRYLGDAAADSDKATNVFSTLWEYNGGTGYINYRMQRLATINDTNPYPAAGCTTNAGPVYSDNTGYSTCLDDDQLMAEIDNVVAAHNLVRDNGHMYVIFLPKHVESCFYSSDPSHASDQACTLNASPSAAYCAYHSILNDNKTVYANMPFPVYSSVIPFTCGSEASFPTNEAPNGDTDADVEISPLSHEISEAMSDPDVSLGWYDSTGYENGDECAYTYGAASGTAGALYNQTINGHHYLTQEEFSNYDFNQGRGGCLQSYYPAAKPGVTQLSSHSGSTAGGSTIILTGTTLGGADSVMFGTVPATFTVGDPTHLRVTVPAHTAGTVNVIVHNAQGSSAVVSTDHYKFS